MGSTPTCPMVIIVNGELESGKAAKRFRWCLTSEPVAKQPARQLIRNWERGIWNWPPSSLNCAWSGDHVIAKLAFSPASHSLVFLCSRWCLTGGRWSGDQRKRETRTWNQSPPAVSTAHGQETMRYQKLILHVEYQAGDNHKHNNNRKDNTLGNCKAITLPYI